MLVSALAQLFCEAEKQGVAQAKMAKKAKGINLDII